MTRIKILSLLIAFSFTLGPLPGLTTVSSLSPVLANNLLVVPYDYPKIQDAINNCSSGSTILIKEGVYVEPIFINKSVKIIGENRTFTIIETPQHVDTITIEANNVILEGLTIRNQMNYTRSYGIKVRNAVNVTISSNIIENHFVGVKLENSELIEICNNLIQRNRYGIFLQWSSRNFIFNNTITSNFWNGIELNYGERNMIYGNTISKNKAFGIEIPEYAPSQFNLVFHNNFLSNEFRHASGPVSNFWDNGKEGNFWDDYKGKDYDLNGIGDELYYLNPLSNEYFDRYPLMGLFHVYKWKEYVIEIVTNSSQISVKEEFFDAGYSKSVLIINYEGYASVFMRLVFNKTISEGDWDLILTKGCRMISSKVLKSNETTAATYMFVGGSIGTILFIKVSTFIPVNELIDFLLICAVCANSVFIIFPLFVFLCNVKA